MKKFVLLLCLASTSCIFDEIEDAVIEVENAIDSIDTSACMKTCYEGDENTLGTRQCMDECDTQGVQCDWEVAECEQEVETYCNQYDPRFRQACLNDELLYCAQGCADTEEMCEETCAEVGMECAHDCMKEMEDTLKDIDL